MDAEKFLKGVTQTPSMWRSRRSRPQGIQLVRILSSRGNLSDL
jgi:hypothetical protein